MAEPFIAEVRIWALNFAPRGWAFCNGQLLPISQNTALFSLIGTTYGGDGRTTTGLPNLQGRAPMHPGNGPGLSSRRIGERAGASTATLSEAQMASHNHAIQAAPDPAEDPGPGGKSFARSVGGMAYRTADSLVALDPDALPPTGGSQTHNNRQPYLGLNFCIALVGLYPSRS